METLKLGKTDISVSRLVIGSWQASDWEKSDNNSFIKVVHHAIDNGLNFIDTAESYGNGLSEQLIGRAVKEKRELVVIATKFSHTNSSPKKIRKSLESSLKRLKTDYIDLYQQHWPPKSPPLEETLLELEKLKKEGIIRAIGVSNWLEDEFLEIENVGIIDTLQPCYSLLWRNVENKALKICLKNKITVLPYSPLCQGLLARKFSSMPKDHRKKNILFKASIDPLIKEIDEIALKTDKTRAQVSLRWLLDKEDFIAPIVGATSTNQVEENLGALGWKLEKEDFMKLDSISKPYSKDLTPKSTFWNWHSRA